MARLMKKVPELMIIIKGLIASFRSVGCTAILQILILYVWSILFVSEYHEQGSDDPNSLDGEQIEFFFGTMGRSMFSLFIYGTILDDVTQVTDMIRGTEGNYVFMLILFIMFILISSFTILNMLIGILCEVVSATAESEKTKAAETCVKDAITTLFDTLDEDGSGQITEEEFNNMRDDKEVNKALEDMDICESHFDRYCEILFHQRNVSGEKVKLSFETIINMILRLNPCNHINALDFSLLQASIDRTQESLRDRTKKMTELISNVTKTGSAVKTEEIDPASAAHTRMAAQGDKPPLQPAITMNSFSSSDSIDERVLPASAIGDGDSKWSMDMFVRTSSHQIIEELERRLGVSALESRLAPMDASTVEAQKAFHSLGVPDE